MKTAQTKFIIKKSLPTILFSLFLLVLSQMAFAQEGLSPTRSIVISPPTIEHKLNPGERAEGVLKITNSGNTDLTFSANIHDFIVEDKNGTPTILTDDTLSEEYSGASWIAVTPNTFTVPAQSTKEINYYLQIPLDAAPGGRYAAAIYEPIDVIQVEGTGAGVNTQLGSLFYITVAGPVSENAKVTSFSVPAFSEFPPVAVTTEIQNLSDIHVKPSGNITIKNIFGQEIARQDFSGGNIFPEASLIYTNQFFTDSNFKIGRYTAELNAIYGQDNNLPLTATVSFIIFPWKIALAVSLVIAIAIVIFFLTKRKKGKKDRESAAPQA